MIIQYLEVNYNLVATKYIIQKGEYLIFRIDYKVAIIIRL